MFIASNRVFLCTALVAVLIISGCNSLPQLQAKPEITFIDIQKFDSELTSSLSTIKKPVEVNFYNPITPNEIPPRLEKWLSLVDKSGGKVNVASPVGEPAPKSPALILGLFSGLWNAIKLLSGESASNSMEDAVKGRDANIQLARNSQGNLYIQKITFNERVAK